MKCNQRLTNLTSNFENHQKSFNGFSEGTNATETYCIFVVDIYIYGSDMAHLNHMVLSPWRALVYLKWRPHWKQYVALKINSCRQKHWIGIFCIAVILIIGSIGISSYLTHQKTLLRGRQNDKFCDKNSVFCIGECKS